MTVFKMFIEIPKIMYLKCSLQPGHRVPRLSFVNYALCVPSSCSNIDVENSVNEYLKDFVSDLPIQYQLRVEEQMCHVKKESVIWSWNAKLSM